ncbi:MAG: hypothetical protein AB1486_18660 [Planctomycetota bacterium]
MPKVSAKCLKALIDGDAEIRRQLVGGFRWVVDNLSGGSLSEFKEEQTQLLVKYAPKETPKPVTEELAA